MKTMNYIKIGIASSILSIAAGCTSFLEEDLKSSLAPDNTYTSSLGFEVGATGLYAIARSEYNTWGENGAFMHNGACAYEVLQISTDLCRMGTVRDGSLVPFAEMTLNPSTLFVGSYWNWAYNLIASACLKCADHSCHCAGKPQNGCDRRDQLQDAKPPLQLPDLPVRCEG